MNTMIIFSWRGCEVPGANLRSPPRTQSRAAGRALFAVPLLVVRSLSWHKMLALLASATPSLSLSHAESRVGCEARRSFCAAVSSPSARAFELALLLAAEERPSEDVAAISSEVDVIVNALAEKARSRLQLETLVGGDPKDPKCIAAATSRVLFGSEGAGEDDDEAFFSGSSQADYYDPRNSYLDAVLERRQGIPITLSLVYAEVAPAHSLLAAYLILTTYCVLQVCD